MDGLIRLNAGLVGLFAFAALHYVVQWWFSRNERVLLVFSIQCSAYAAFCLAMMSFLGARTVPDAQAGMDRCVTLGVLVHAVVVNLYAHLGNRRDRVFRGIVTGALAFLTALNLWAPLRGTVIALKAARLPGGATALVPIRTPPGASLVLLYVVLMAASGYGLVVARMTWKRDRTGAVFIAVGTFASLAGIAVASLVDFAKVRVPFPGAVPHAIFVVCMAFYLSREYAARGARLAVSERRAEGSLRETQEALANLEAEQRRREESEAARHRAMEAVVQAQRKEIASELAAGVAHDFNTVLNVLSLWSNMLLSDSLPPEEEETARLALASAQAQGQALSRQLMTLARPESRAPRRFPLDRPIRTTAQTLTPALPRGINFEYEAPATIEVEADETEIQQVIYNLVLNARDAQPHGGAIQVTGAVETSSIPIAVVGGSLVAGRWATLMVKDSGPGIDPTIRERIFDLFFTTKGQDRGTGLGLATVLRIARANGGGVALESTAGSGATFKVYLPACEPPAASRSGDVDSLAGSLSAAGSVREARPPRRA